MAFTPDAKQVELVKKLLDQLFNSEDDDFLGGLLNAVQDDTIPDYTKAQGLDLKDVNWRIIKEMSKPGPYFDLRFAGGVYRFEDNDMGFFELLVDSSKGTVLVDGEPTDSVQVKEGAVTFSTKSQHHFEVRFECSQILGEGKLDPHFSGNAWTTGGEKTPSPVTGRKYYLWGDVQKREDDDTDENTHDHVPKWNTKTPVSKEKLEAAATARDDAAVDSLAVSMDFMSTRYTPPKEGETVPGIFLLAIDKGDFYLEGIHIAATIAGAVLGAFLTGGANPIGGAAAGAAGAQASRFITAGVKTRYQSKQMRKMKDYIATRKVKVAQWIKGKVEEYVNNYSRDYLESPEMIEDIRGKLEKEYRLEASAQLRKAVKKKFRKFHHLWKTDYQTTFDKGVEDKFKNEVSTAYLKGLVGKQRDIRLIEKDLPTEIRKAQERQTELENQKENELKEARNLPNEAERNRRIEEIHKKYEADLERAQRRLKEKTDKEKELKDKEPGKDIDGRIEDLEREAEARRQREERAQRERREREVRE